MMKKITEQIQKIRNIGIIAHIDAGKTTVSERILYYTHKIHRMGEVHDGNATMDFMPEEQERGITITAASTNCLWNDFQLNLIDTPGHVDFTIEVERSLQVLDGAIGIFCAVGGVEPQSETVWKQSENLYKPKLAFINKLDRIGADFENVLLSMQEKLQTKPLVLQIPAGQGQDFQGIIDLLTLKQLTFNEENQGETYTLSEPEEELKIEAEIWQEKLIEDLADLDDDFATLYLENTYTIQDIQKSIRKICINRLATPVLMGSALKNTGIQPLLDAVCAYLPSPFDVSPLNTDNYKEEDIQALIFKVLLEKNHRFSLVRIYNGCIKENTTLYNINTNTKERIDQLYKIHADFHEKISQAHAGDLVGIIGLKSSLTGHTLSNNENFPAYEDFHKYKPVISLAFEPKNSEEAEILDLALEKFTLEDPTLLVSIEQGTRLVSGMGELHLAILAERIEREYKISPRTGNPEVILKETIQNATPLQDSYHYHREIGEKLHQGHITITISKNSRNSGNQISFNETILTQLSKYKSLTKEDTKTYLTNFIINILETGFNEKSLVDLNIHIDNLFEEEYTSLLGIQNAIQFCLHKIYNSAIIKTLYPIMKVEINTPDENLGAVMNLLNTCKAKIEQLSEKQKTKYIEALAPMHELFGFATSLRSVSQGRAGLSIQFLQYDTI